MTEYRAVHMLLLFNVAHACRSRIPNYHGCVTPRALQLKYCNSSLSLDARLDDLLSHFTLEEKIAQLTPQPDYDLCSTVTRGKPEIGLDPYYWLVETNTNVGAACIAKNHCTTTFVGPLGMAASFNRTLWHLKGIVMGSEMRALNNIGGGRKWGNRFLLYGLTGFGPNINIARDPRFGRNSELPGEDPLLSGHYAAEMVKGMQERDNETNRPNMGAFLKHFTAYSRETNRGHDTYNISTFDFFDSYLPQFHYAFQHAQPAGVMCSYNGENGKPSCANDWLLNKQLRKWAPNAIVTSDCGAVGLLRGPPAHAPDDMHAAAYALMNGTDVEMGSRLFTVLQNAVRHNLTMESRITEAVRRAFRLLFDLGRFDPLKAPQRADLATLNSTAHQRIAYEAALQSIVLLKNKHDCLPIRAGVHVAVVGPQANARFGLLSDYVREEICFPVEGFDPNYCVVTIANGIKQANKDGKVTWSKGVDINSTDTEGIANALRAAAAADVVVLALGIDRSIERENVDRVDTRLPGLQEPFALQILKLNKPTILVLTNGGALAIDSLVDRPHSSNAPYAIVEAFNPCTVGASALGQLLFGHENRWGKLPITLYPHDYINQQPADNYDMARAPGRTYRYYQSTPLFPFGFGLSLASFSLACKPVTVVTDGIVASYTCTVSNKSGRFAGDEVVLVYHRLPQAGRKFDHPLPQRSLVDFTRTPIVPSESSVEIDFHLTRDAFMVVNAQGQKTLYSGVHEIIISCGSVLDEQVFRIHVATADQHLVSKQRV